MRMKLFFLFILLIIIGILTTGLGSMYISPLELIRGLLDQDHKSAFIIYEYRLPRTILSALAGSALAVAGVLMQGMIRNPLASPDVVGVSKGAGFAAVVVIILFPSAPSLLLPISAFIGAGLAAFALVLLSRRTGMRPDLIALTGLALGAVFQALTDYILVKYPLETGGTLTWLAGSLWGKGWDEIYGLLPWWGVLLPIAYLLHREMDIISLDEQSSSGLGLRTKTVRLLLLIISVGLAGSAVAAIGSIGFVGLLAPHIAHRLVGIGHRYLLPSAACIGAILLMLADAVGRGLRPPIEIPAGIVITVIGAPYFVYLLLRERFRS